MVTRRKLAAIMFTDLTGFTSRTHQDEREGLGALREHQRLVAPILEAFHGRQVKSLGDGLLIEFGNALDAVNCAVELQRRLHERNQGSETPALRMRIGIHLGDVERRGSDIVGDSVNIASRIEPLADPGGACISAQVFDQVRNKVPYPMAKLGPKNLKGIHEPVEVYRILLPWSAASASGEPSGAPRLAVLPLANISPDPKDEYLADGLTEEMISVLSQIHDLRVISRTSVNQYRATTKTLAQIGAELGVDAILEGSVRKAGDQLRITVQLIDPRTDEHLWAQTFDRPLENIFAIQTEVARHTAAALQLQLGRSEQTAIQTPPTTNLIAYSLYLQALHAAHSVRSADWELAIRRVEDALRADPNFALALATLGNYLVAVGGETRPLREVVPRARSVIGRALELAPDLAEAHAARGNLAMQADHDWSLAEQEFLRALTLNLSSSEARTWYGILCLTLQRYDEAKEQLRRAIELDPGLDWISIHLVRAHLLSGDLPAAFSAARDSVARFPASTTARISLALCLAIGGDLAAARSEVDAALHIVAEQRCSDDQIAETRFWHAIVVSWSGDLHEARLLREQWKEGSAQVALRPSLDAGLWAALGEIDRALQVLETEASSGGTTLWFHYQAPFLDPVRAHPRFKTLLRQLGLPTEGTWHRGGIPQIPER